MNVPHRLYPFRFLVGMRATRQCICAEHRSSLQRSTFTNSQTSVVLLPRRLITRSLPDTTLHHLAASCATRQGRGASRLVFSALRRSAFGSRSTSGTVNHQATLLTVEPLEASTQCVTEDLTSKNPWIVTPLIEPITT